MTVKTIYLAKRNPGTTYEEFQKNWADHAVLSGSFPDVGARFNAVVQVKRIVGLEDEPGLFQEYDGANLLTLTSLADSIEVYDQEGIPTLRIDEKRVFDDYVSESSMTGVESVLNDVPLGKVVLLELVRRKPGTNMAQFVKAWSGVYARSVMATDAFTSKAGRYLHTHIILPTPPGYAYDGISETWFDSVDDALAYVREIDKVDLDDEGFDLGFRTMLDLNHAWIRRPKTPKP
ncbi:hypothetical protein BH09ACT10_BH09ACT10_30660 [soil metagenome]